MKVILYCGDRDWNDPEPIKRSFDREQPDVVIHGAAKGADTLAGREAGLRGGIEVLVYPAQWNRYGRAAGPLRNSAMLGELLRFGQQGATIKVVAFHPDIENSKGTRDMVRKAKQAGVETEVIL